jgi:hypothetical protein
MSNKKELKEHVMLSLTPTEKQDLRDIAKCMLGNENMSQMVRYWITKYKDKKVSVDCDTCTHNRKGREVCIYCHPSDRRKWEATKR